MSPAARRTTLTLLAVILGFGFIDRIVIALVAQQIKADFELSDFQIGLLGGTAFAVVNAFASIPLARLAERRSRAWIMAGSLAVASLFTAACAATASFAQLLALRLGMAAGSAGTEAPAHSMISDMYPPERRASAISLFMLGIPLAAIAGSWMGGAIAQGLGWRMTFFAFGAIGFAAALLAAWLMTEPGRGTPAADHAPEGASLGGVIAILWRRSEFRHILIGVSLVSLGSFGVNTFLPAFLTRSFALGIADAGLAFGLITGIASAVGTVIGGYASEYMARRHRAWLLGVPALGLVVGAPVLVLGITRESIALAVPLILTGSIFFYMAMGPAVATTHALLDSRSRATGSALLLMVMHLVGQGLGPPVAGFVSDMAAAWQYGGDFASACAGAAGQIPGSACAAASAIGLRHAMMSFAVFYLWAALHLYLGARRSN